MNASRKKDRETIAAWFIDAATRHGATIERKDIPADKGWHGPRVDLSATINGVGVSVSVHDLHGGLAGIASWHNDQDGRGPKARLFTPEFNAAVGDLTHYRPHHKATSAGDWETLALYVDRGLRLASLDQAFLEESSL